MTHQLPWPDIFDAKTPFYGSSIKKPEYTLFMGIAAPTINQYFLPVQTAYLWEGVEQSFDYGQILRSVLESLRTILSEIRMVLAEIRGHWNVCISTFSPEPYTLYKPIPVSLKTTGESIVATFFDANISTSGETEEEAFSNVRSLILDTFDSLSSESPNELGTEPTRQLAVLRSFLQKNA